MRDNALAMRLPNMPSRFHPRAFENQNTGTKILSSISSSSLFFFPFFFFFPCMLSALALFMNRLRIYGSETLSGLCCTQSEAIRKRTRSSTPREGCHTVGHVPWFPRRRFDCG